MKIVEKTKTVYEVAGETFATRKEAERAVVTKKLESFFKDGKGHMIVEHHSCIYYEELLKQKDALIEILTMFDKQPEDVEDLEELDPYLTNAPDPGEGYRLLERGELVTAEDEIHDLNSKWEMPLTTGFMVVNSYFRRKVEE